MGLAGEQPALQLARTLARIAAAHRESPDVESALLQNRLDLRLQRMQMDELARRSSSPAAPASSMCWTWGRRVSCRARRSPTSGATKSRWKCRYSTAAARVKRAEAIYAQAVDRFTQAAIEAARRFAWPMRATARPSNSRGSSATKCCPRASRSRQENLLRYNASQISIFELLAGCAQPDRERQ